MEILPSGLAHCVAAHSLSTDTHGGSYMYTGGMTHGVAAHSLSTDAHGGSYWWNDPWGGSPLTVH